MSKCALFLGPEGIVECDLIPVLIKKLPAEADEIKVYYSFDLE